MFSAAVTLFDCSTHRTKKLQPRLIFQTKYPQDDVPEAAGRAAIGSGRQTFCCLLRMKRGGQAKDGWHHGIAGGAGKRPAAACRWVGNLLSTGNGTAANSMQQPSRVVHYLAHSQALVLAKAFGFTGPILMIANACASGANAIGHASGFNSHR